MEQGTEFEIIKKALAEHGMSVKQFTDRYDDDKKELKARILDLEQKGAHKPAGGSFGGSGNPGASIAKIIADSAQFKSLANGELKECRIALPPGAFERKSYMLGSTTPALQPPDRSAEITGFAMRRMTVRALLPSLPTEAGATQYSRLSSFVNNAAIQSGGSPVETEGAAKAESALGFELITSPIVTIAHWTGASNQVLSDMAALSQFIDTWMTYGLDLAVENELLNGSGTGNHIAGILDQATPYTGASTGDTKLDAIRKGITQLQLAAHVPSGIVMHPTDWQHIELTKNTLGDYLEVTLSDANGNPIAWRVPVIPTVAIAAGQFLVGDFQSALVRDRQQATIEVSNSHQDFFTRNLVAIRAECRLGLEVHRPAGFITGTF